ncbi:DUF4293 domain-containing protein [Prolixibacter denitrificans]|jgi:hypothetical protein|uniref:Membrane protein n=1 Tax=Prolixibacter denitrificans TaxID=1541063 RepID=A0A2P8CE82_9BACT|nr:DUF4293 domain-containing protein [Prolixibacter denitrificans]PSK83232.1 uncharacterized protein DUF4293 [Prolixibacter denitrificans]GET21885.1 membrane protein [Prolixibacter denitrificans]
MLQRIQSIYLLGALLLIVALFFVPFAEIVGSDGSIYVFDKAGIYLQGAKDPEILYSGLAIQVFLGIIVLVNLVTIFSFKKRIRQIRLSVFNILLMIGLSGVIYYFASHSAKLLDGKFSFEPSLVMPLIAVVLTYLAIRSIGRDEALVRSIDRIR